MTATRQLLLATALIIMAATPAAVAEEPPWFDLTGCAMCKNMTAEEGLMDAMEWEVRKIDAGVIEIVRVDPDYEEAFLRAMDNMEQAGQRLMAGEQMHLCGYCTSYGALMMGGAHFEHIETDICRISMTTSTDPAMVAKIHEHAEKTIKEYKAMVAHEGEHEHGHGDEHGHHHH